MPYITNLLHTAARGWRGKATGIFAFAIFMASRAPGAGTPAPSATPAAPSATPAAISFSLGQNSSKPLSDSDVVAKVGNAQITVGDVAAILGQLDPAKRAEVVKDPALLEQLVKSAALKRVVLEEALAQKWDEQPDVKELVERARNEAVADSYLISKISVPPDYPGDAEVKAYYDANKAKLTTAPQYHLAQIVIAIPANATKTLLDGAQGRVNDLRKRLHLGEVDFATLAREVSDQKESGGRGGDIGWVEESKLPATIRTQVTHLDVNNVSDPILLDDGWHFVKLLDVREPRIASLDEVRSLIVQELRAERVRAAKQAYLAKLLQQNPVSIDARTFGAMAGEAVKK